MLSAIDIRHVVYHYGNRKALADLSFSVAQGEIFALVGPNGGGKTTLFRLLATLIPLEQGEVQLLGFDLRTQVREIQESIGVVFQSPSLDKKLTVLENLLYQGQLYGLSGKALRNRSHAMLDRLGLTNRARERAETLSGGLRRRVDLAKGMLHEPRLLLMDEPTTGLDPAARSDLWRHLEELRRENGVTILVTTHLLEEADRADRIAILHQGTLVALDSPEQLRSTVGGDSLTIKTPEPSALAAAITDRFACPASVIDGSVRLELPEGHAWVARLVEAFPGKIESVTLGKPTLEDVFIARTGHRFWQSQEAGGG